jgi:hypothetical protein
MTADRRRMVSTLSALLLTSLPVCAVGCGGSGHSASGSQPIERSTPSAGVVKGWAAKWCEAQPGITKRELYRIMGPPTSEFPSSASWTGYEWMFNAFFDTNGNVRQLDINDLMLSSAEKASLQCDTTRVVP